MTACCAAATVSIRWRVATSPSQSVIWQTPPALYLALDKEFAFTVDAAADQGNALCDRYFDREADALAQSFAGERVFCNPPYGQQLTSWTQKAMTSAQDEGALWVLVLPARTDVAWFHRFVLPHAEIRFIKGRLKFTRGGQGSKDAPFASMVTIFHPWRVGEGHIRAQPVFPGFER